MLIISIKAIFAFSRYQYTTNFVMKIALVNCDIEWESPEINLLRYGIILDGVLQNSDLHSDIIVFPEFFNTGFSVSDSFAEPHLGKTYNWLKMWSKRLNSAILTSIPVFENGKCFNRAYFVTKTETYIYDKSHLFTPGGEDRLFAKGDGLKIINYNGFNIALQICYDLRFPVWCRNKNLSYDLIINIANWPSSRDSVIEPLCKARAIENLSFFAFVNRCGKDPNNRYSGQRLMFDYMGNTIEPLINKEDLAVFEISKTTLAKYREKFPVWKDSDDFNLI